MNSWDLQFRSFITCRCSRHRTADGLSKRDGDLDLGVLREKFGRPEPIVGMLAKAAGLRPTAQPVQLSDLVADFSWDKIPKQDIALPEEILQ